MAAERSAILVVVKVVFDGVEVPDPAWRVDLAAFDLTFGRWSDISDPAAEGGCFGGFRFGEGFLEEVLESP
jgi:hypothetical protein